MPWTSTDIPNQSGRLALISGANSGLGLESARALLRKGANAQRQMTEALATTYICGHRPDFAARFHTAGRRLELPTYPFQRRRY